MTPGNSGVRAGSATSTVREVGVVDADSPRRLVLTERLQGVRRPDPGSPADEAVRAPVATPGDSGGQSRADAVALSRRAGRAAVGIAA